MLALEKQQKSKMAIETNALSPVFYIILLTLIVIMGLIIYFMKKTKSGLKQILKSISISLIITFFIEVLLWIIGRPLFSVFCATGKSCPSKFDVFLGLLPYTAIAIFLITLLIYYIIKLAKSK